MVDATIINPIWQQMVQDFGSYWMVAVLGFIIVFLLFLITFKDFWAALILGLLPVTLFVIAGYIQTSFLSYTILVLGVILAGSISRLFMKGG